MKYHNNLEDSQIHNAKGFAPARPRSVSAKDSSGSVDWVKCNYTSSVAVTTIADVEGRLHHKYFALYNSNDATKYAVYFDITSVAAFSTPAGYGGVIQVNATATGNNSTAVQLAGYLHTAINGHGDFSSSDDSVGAVGIVTITGMASATHPYDSDNSTSFGFVATDTEVVSEVLTTDASGNMEWITKAALAAATGDMTGVDLTGGTGISIESETNTTSGDYSATITCNVEGTEVASTGVTGTTKFLRVDGDNTCSWQIIPKQTESFIIACSDETTALTTGAAKTTFRMPYAFTLTEVRASVTTAPSGDGGDNVVTGDNSTFATGTGDWGQFRGVLSWDSSLQAGKWTDDNTGGGSTGFTMSGGDIPTAAATTYKLEFSAKTDSAASFNFAYIGEGPTFTTISNPNLTSSFQDYEFIFTTSTANQRLYIGFGTSPLADTESFWINNVSLKDDEDLLTVDINEGGSTILSTKLTIDASETTSTTAATPAVISDSTLADDSEITIDIDTVGTDVAGVGLKVTLIGTQT